MAPSNRERERYIMKAARVHRFGPPEVITIDETATPLPGDDEILVRVAACGVGPWDAWVRAGKSVIEQPLPLTLGADLSGTVAQLSRRRWTTVPLVGFRSSQPRHARWSTTRHAWSPDSASSCTALEAA
jgi:hypothetical protein